MRHALGLLTGATAALNRLDERVARSSVAAGFVECQNFADDFAPARMNAAALAGSLPVLSASLVAMAERLFAIRPFVPDGELPGNWRDLLGAWLAGIDVVALGRENMRIVEDAFVSRLPGAIEAICMRRRTEATSNSSRHAHC
ncbi:hypothetical protein [Rhizobium metallidurans]|uniref:Uncharacterized protein n=1 Tax=Rhizobium metallidurans TaxID=1265931 RepID=A0A7W6CY50_9HYPH|nr:hypothetical protein [Rhizobium metallidurans]MBB3966997.1 hypothetical protein [Rhizobium metallidurans]